MHKRLYLSLAVVLVAAAAPCFSQDPVVPAADPEALFQSGDPKLQVNKQAAYHIVKDLLEAGHWEMADQYPKDPTKGYTTTWFDMWRFKEGKADEHWDPATKLGP